MFLPIIDAPAVQYVMPQPECAADKAGRKWPERTPCPNNCSWTDSRGEVHYGYRSYVLGHPICQLCWIPDGPSTILNLDEKKND